MNKSLPLVIVGSGGAALNAVIAARQAGYQGELHLFSDSYEPPYNPMLTTYYLAGKIPLEKCYMYGNNFDFFKQHSVTFHLGSPVVEINTKEQTVINDASNKIHYQKCLIASGAEAIFPPLPGIKSQRIFSLRTLQDAQKLREVYLRHPRRVLIVGASMVGIKLVEIFHEAGTEVYLADLAPHVFSLAAHPESAEVIEEHLTKQGIKLILNAKVNGIEDSRQGIKVSFESSVPDLEVDFVVFAIGVRPNLDFIRSSELQIDKGILVNESMQTGVSDLYAAGDVAQATNLLNQNKEIIALWANACSQGRVAGANMAGAHVLYPGSIPQNITHFFDMFFVSIGDTRGNREVYISGDNNTFSFVFKVQGKIVGVNLLTRRSHEIINSAGIYRQKILRAMTNPNSFPGRMIFPNQLWDVV